MNEENIVYTEYAVANVYKDGTIEIHKDLNLPEWSHLKRKILKHERDHDFNKGFFYNLGVDFFSFIGAGEILQFMFMRPKTWIQLLPFYYIRGKGFVYDTILLFFYSVILGSILIVIKFFGGM